MIRYTNNDFIFSAVTHLVFLILFLLLDSLAYAIILFEFFDSFFRFNTLHFKRFVLTKVNLFALYESFTGK